MKNYSYFLFLIWLIFVSSCSYIKNVLLLTKGEINRKNYVQTIPFEWRKELIVVKAQLNADTVLREFIFDTGAFNSKVESDLANSLGLEIITSKTNSTAQGISQKIEVVRIDSLQFGETTIYNIGAGKLTYAPTSASPCIAASGIIGANLIQLAHWKIDYQNQLLHFSDTPFEVKEGSYVLPFKRPVLSGTPTIHLEIEGKKVENVLFDVGYNGGLILPLSQANHFKNAESKITLDQSTSGIYGTNTDSLLVKNLAVNVGGAKTQMPVEFSALNKSLLGNEFLKHFTVIINYDKKEIYLQKQQEIQIAPPRSFLVAIQSDSLWVVSRTTPELPLRLGETLLSVNGKKPQELFTSHCDYVMNVAKLLEQDSLVVQKMNGSFLNITIK
jgi:predicted aspartyl protease